MQFYYLELGTAERADAIKKNANTEDHGEQPWYEKIRLLQAKML